MKSIAYLLPPLLLLLLIFLSSAIAAGDTFNPTDSILLQCGATSDATDVDGRKWTPDTSTSKLFRLTSGNSTTAQASYQDPSLPSTVPYMTARVFTTQSTYTFPISTKDHHWLRLHFYPDVYNGLSTDAAFFSVSANPGNFTLLHNFSAHITAKALTLAYIVKEYALPPLSDETLTLTFTPSDKLPNSYAFINGIELVTMPNIYTSSPPKLVGVGGGIAGGMASDSLSLGAGLTQAETIDVAASAMQMLYRLNVGGQYIPSSNDSGVTRTWYDDSPYIWGAASGIPGAAADRLKIDYPKDMPEYTAPVDVYRTSRTMGDDPAIVKNYNLTWNFQVDPSFFYMLRLHFCEFVMTKPNQRVFDIFINNQTAESGADVVAWSSARGVPVYKDYAVQVEDADELWLALHPTAGVKSEYSDAILNGVEVFKLSDPSGNLAGPNPVPSDMLVEAEAANPGFKKSESQGNAHVIGGAAGGAAALGLVFAICIAVHVQRKKRAECCGDSASGWLPIYGNSTTSSTTSKSTISGRSTTSSSLSAMAAGLCRHFSIDEIKKGTKNFDESLVIGVGGFGKVYKGVVDGNVMVAIKRSNPQSEQGVNEFQTEIEMLSKLRHKHLVSLIGFCDQNDEMCLVYDYMAYGTLREHLYKHNKPPLSWKQRLEICIGSARGLHYLHTGAKYTIIHRDVKTTNILLDENWTAKVSDFGLSKTGPTMNETHVSTVVKGSFGYLDPEYFRRQQLTEKSDVYSFGVVLFEVLCARPALNPSLPKEQVSLADWALHCKKKGVLEDIVDPLLKGKINQECFNKFTETAEKCLSDHGLERPSMGDVLWNLEFALQLQESADGGGKTIGAGAEEGSGSVSSHNHSGSCTDGDMSEVSGVSEGLDSTAVFSQLIHPMGR